MALGLLKMILTETLWVSREEKKEKRKVKKVKRNFQSLLHTIINMNYNTRDHHFQILIIIFFTGYAKFSYYKNSTNCQGTPYKSEFYGLQECLPVFNPPPYEGAVAIKIRKESAIMYIVSFYTDTDCSNQDANHHNQILNKEQCHVGNGEKRKFIDHVSILPTEMEFKNNARFIKVYKGSCDYPPNISPLAIVYDGAACNSINTIYTCNTTTFFEAACGDYLQHTAFARIGCEVASNEFTYSQRCEYVFPLTPAPTQAPTSAATPPPPATSAPTQAATSAPTNPPTSSATEAPTTPTPTLPSATEEPIDEPTNEPTENPTEDPSAPEPTSLPDTTSSASSVLFSLLSLVVIGVLLL